MARLSKEDCESFKQVKPWRQSREERESSHVAQTTEARARYCRWASQAALFYKGQKPVRFVGSNWKL